MSQDHNENGHTPLMEAASAGHCTVARILLEFGAGINTHRFINKLINNYLFNKFIRLSNEFKESALTLACYKGHLEMVRFLLEAGADQVWMPNIFGHFVKYFWTLCQIFFASGA